MTAVIYSSKLTQKFRTCLRNHALPEIVDGVEKFQKTQKRTSSPPPKTGLFLEFVETYSTKAFLDDQFGTPPRALTIAPLVNEQDGDVAVWLGFTSRFDYAVDLGDFALTSISLSFVRGLRDLRCMVRAEWDSRMTTSHGSSHAQPHWHGYPVGTVKDLRDPIDFRWAKIQTNIHLAMCANWGDPAVASSTHCNPLDSSADPVDWLDRCLSYGRQQLQNEINANPLKPSTTSPSMARLPF